jgi:thioredoxin reductase
MGGGYVGLELAQAMRRFGSRVTIIERNERLAHREDEDVSEALADLCRDEAIKLVLGARVSRVEGKSGQSVRLQLMRAGSEIILQGTHLLVAIGRVPNTEGIGLELAGVEVSDGGYIKVNEQLETTAPGAPRDGASCYPGAAIGQLCVACGSSCRLLRSCKSLRCHRPRGAEWCGSAHSYALHAVSIFLAAF